MGLENSLDTVAVFFDQLKNLISNSLPGKVLKIRIWSQIVHFSGTQNNKLSIFRVLMRPKYQNGQKGTVCLCFRHQTGQI